MSTERLLVHGPRIDDLTDLLCFDRIVFPATTAIRRPRDCPPGYAGYPIEEALTPEARERLVEAGVVTSPVPLILAASSEDTVAQLLSGDGSPLELPQSIETDVGTLTGMAFSSLDTPATRADVAAWIAQIDAKVAKVAGMLATRGHRAVPKLFAADVTRTLRPGWSVVLSVAFPRFPGLEVGRVDLEALIAFLTDSGTIEKRRALFDWPLAIEADVRHDRIRIAEVPDRIAQALEDYGGWIMQSGLPTRVRVVELLLVFDASFIDRLTAVRPSDRIAEIVTLSQRGLALSGEDRTGSGRELAFVSHGRRGYDE